MLQDTSRVINHCAIPVATRRLDRVGSEKVLWLDRDLARRMNNNDRVAVDLVEFAWKKLFHVRIKQVD